ncbi:MAG: family N-acetyltransferase [Herbinix sp.]|jgi:RimJ/RimL family protein N-acetyltransferase|nr:family N-acetyltransferase [Herbinix sp.]
MLIRKVTEEDAQDFLAMQLQLDRETKNMMFEPEERPNDVDRTRSMIKSATTNNNLLLCAVIEEELVGFLSASKGSFQRNRHSAYIVIGLLQKARSKGFGRQLFDQLLLWAKEQGLTRLELTVLCRNTDAIALYQKYGFKIEGTKHRSLFIDGEYEDEYYMGLLL